MGPLHEILETLSNDQNLDSTNIVEKIKQEFERRMDELYPQWDTCKHKYKLCKKEYKSWQKSGFSLDHDFKEGGKLLHLAAKCNYLNVIKCLKDRGAGIDIQNWRGNNPLHEAVEDGRQEMVQFLLENGANINAKTETRGEETPLSLAVNKACPIYQQGTAEDHQKYIEKYVEIIKLLIREKADVNASDPLGWAVGQGGSINLVKLLVENGAVILDGHLHAAANAGNKDIAEFLIDNGADINAQNAQGSTPLHKVSGIDTLKLLIERGAKVNIKNGEGFTPLHYMAFMLDEASTLIMVEHGADPWARGDNGETPVDRYVNRLEHAKEEGASGTDEPPGYLMKLKQAYNKDLFVRYSTLLLGAVAAITLFTTGNITPDAPRIIGAAALVTVAALAAGRITYEVFKPSTKNGKSRT
ncbi:hypothetical protein TNCT_444961 [Trichonephila clavata]|uniref:Ankyrin repeat protein n=1 Tax=Trichonephila clavata TaxID=2740835 RepID=A0A8X6LKX3_TRICU|nr:hypothetical protein TNCT_444961 [Trichonephila clavata]